MIKKQRESGIELLKIISMILIVFAHTAQNAYRLKLPELMLAEATLSKQKFIMAWLIHFGSLGNYLFIICSAWFLIGSKKSQKQKILPLVFDSFLISVLFLAGYSIVSPGMVSQVDITKSFFPIFNENNWFVTGYILFLLILPYLNKIVENISQRQLMRISIVMILLYWIFCFAKAHYFFTRFFVFIGLFFIVAYIKKYMPDFCSSTGKNLICLAVGVFGFILWLGGTDIRGLNDSAYSQKLLMWWTDSNPFHLLTAIALFNLFRKFKFVNKGINLISSLTLYIYLIHENMLFRQYSAQPIWRMLIDRFSVKHVLAEEILFATLLFTAAVLLSLLYKFTAGRFTGFISGKIYNSGKVRKALNKFETKIINIK